MGKQGNGSIVIRFRPSQQEEVLRRVVPLCSGPLFTFPGQMEGGLGVIGLTPRRRFTDSCRTRVQPKDASRIADLESLLQEYFRAWGIPAKISVKGEFVSIDYDPAAYDRIDELLRALNGRSGISLPKQAAITRRGDYEASLCLLVDDPQGCDILSASLTGLEGVRIDTA